MDIKEGLKEFSLATSWTTMGKGGHDQTPKNQF
jgi:hypothetical protein